VAGRAATYSYREGMKNGDIGYATAIRYLPRVISLILILGCNQFSKKVLRKKLFREGKP
jgi:putative aldouronate transport system permease protein